MRRKAFLQCSSGISGDMLLGALVDLGVDAAALAAELGKLKLPGFKLDITEKKAGGLRATKVTPRFGKKCPVFRNLAQVNEALKGSSVDSEVAGEAKRLFHRLADAEASVHGGDAGTVHFHELGSADTMVDIVGVLWAWRHLGIDEGFASGPNVGSGEIRTEHGVFTVPAPATAKLLEGWPVFSDGEQGEKTTPTGALLLTHLCRPAAGLPHLVLEQSGRGAGDREFESRPNVLQVLLGSQGSETVREELLVLETNIDDLNPQVLGGLTGQLLGSGALEAYITPVVMKKGRPGHLVTALVPRQKESLVGALVMRETGTLGYRTYAVDRTRIEREVIELRTTGGSVRVKTASLNGEVVRFSPEFEDCRRIAEKTGRPVKDVMEEVLSLRSRHD